MKPLAVIDRFVLLLSRSDRSCSRVSVGSWEGLAEGCVFLLHSLHLCAVRSHSTKTTTELLFFLICRFFEGPKTGECFTKTVDV